MGIFDRFKRKNENVVEKNEESVIINEITNNDTETNNDDTFKETLSKIRKANDLTYIPNGLVKKMEEYPDLVDLLLKGEIPRDILYKIMYSFDEKFLPDNQDDLKYAKYLSFDDSCKKKIAMLEKKTDYVPDSSKYVRVELDFEHLESVDVQNSIPSYISNIEINIYKKMAIKTGTNPFIQVYLPKEKCKVFYHDYHEYVEGNIELDEDAIIQTDYEHFKYLDDSIVKKISKCKLSLNDFNFVSEHDNHDTFNYKKIKCNHLVYIIRNSSLTEDEKNRLLYELKDFFSRECWFCGDDISNNVLPGLKKIDRTEIEKLTKAFEDNIDSYSYDMLEEIEFNVTFYVDDFFEKQNIKIIDIIDFIKRTKDEYKIEVLKEPRIKKALDIPENISNEELNRLLILIENRLMPKTMEFVNSIDFDVEKFLEDPTNDHKSSLDVNSIIKNFGEYDLDQKQVVVSVADILGHDGIVNSVGGYKGNNILHTFENFFDNYGDSYHTRANGLLEYKSGEELLKELRRRNDDTKDMRIKEIEDGKYILAGNGLHRYTVLRFHYLVDRMKKNKNEEELKEMYKIPVTYCGKVNYKKTYCNYMISRIDHDIELVVFNSKNNEAKIYYSNKQSKIVTEEELLNMIAQSVDLLSIFDLEEIKSNYDRYESFRKFVDEYIPNLLDMINIKDEENVKK